MVFFIMKIYSTKENLQVLFEDNHLIVVNKRVGDIVQGDQTGDKPLSEVVQEYLKHKYNKPGAVYLGVVHTLTHYLTRNPKNNTSKAHIKEVKDSKKAILDYKVIKKLDRYVALEIDLHTGRHHQIRCQLSAIGCPIKGDLKYGFDRSNSDGGIHLHARKLKITHPVTKEILQIIAPVPNDIIWKNIEKV